MFEGPLVFIFCLVCLAELLLSVVEQSGHTRVIPRVPRLSHRPTDVLAAMQIINMKYEFRCDFQSQMYIINYC